MDAISFAPTERLQKIEPILTLPESFSQEE